MLSNDCDPDNDNMTVDVATVAPAAYGTVVSINTDGSFVYSPPEWTDFTGEDVFLYRNTDGAAFSNYAAVAIHIYGVDIDTDSDNGGTIFYPDGEDANEELDPGKIFHINNDDDNDNNVPDQNDPAPFVNGQGNPVFDYDLTWASMSYDSAGLNFTGYTLELVPSAGVQLWATQDKQPLSPNLTYTIGTDTIPTSIRVEGIAPGPATVDLVLKNGQTELDRDTVKFTVVHFDLDVDADGALGGPNDGVANYLPGYRGNDPFIGIINGFEDWSYSPQKTKVVVEGISPNQGITAVEFEIVDVTSIPGFAENASDPLIEAGSNDEDYSFSALADQRTAFGILALFSDSYYQEFWAKDFGGSATVRVDVKKDGASVFNWSIDVPLDRDFDFLADSWERQKVTEWNTQFGTAEPVDNTFFFNEDKELRDPDGATNTDGGHDMPAHKSAGDSLSVFQEYRGFVIDGGHGQIGGRHTRLSPAHKELLIEVDKMAAVPNMPFGALFDAILNDVTTEMEHLTSGAGIHAYWVLDEENITHTIFSTEDEMIPWGRNHMHSALGEFVHLSFVDQNTFYPSNVLGVALRPPAVTPDPGAFVFITHLWDSAIPFGYDFIEGIIQTSIHETTHMLLNANGAPGFDSSEHVPDPDPADPLEGPLDLPYLMHSRTSSVNISNILYSDITRRELNLTSKESVER